MPLNLRIPVDRFIWHFDRGGRFSVKRIYHVACNWIREKEPAASSSFESRSIACMWNRIWAARVHPKVKLGAYRLCKNIIPTKVNLHRHIKIDASCILCHGELESSLHLMRDCYFAQCDWLASPIGKTPDDPNISTMQDWAFFLKIGLSFLPLILIGIISIESYGLVVDLECPQWKAMERHF